ncbi:MAG: SCE4755 family polysaccharide monooxygenase-like protein [Polyangiaceae bacterium]
MPVAHATKTPALAFAFAIGALGMLVPSVADAHFRLLYPPQWIQESDTFGDPQKAAPCGVDSQATYTLTGDVTSFAPGQTIMLHWVETVPHDGWFRISLSYANRADLTDPPYQTDPLSGWSVDAGIEDPPVAPVLVDGLFKHTAASISVPKDYTYALTLPMQPCVKCTLQIEQIMLNHPVNQTDGPFTYHHCADIAIVTGADGGTITTVPDGGKTVVPTPNADGGGAANGGGSGGSTSGATSGSGSYGAADAGGAASGSAPSGAAGANDNSAGSGAGGCALSGRGTNTAAGLGLVAFGFAAIWRRRRRR